MRGDLIFMIKTQGKQVKEEEHLELLEKMKQLKSNTVVTYVKGATVEQVLKELESCDEVVCKLKDGSILRVCKDYKIFINGILADSVNPTSNEQGSTYEQGIRKSNNFTGEQLFKKLILKYLN